MGLKKIIKKWGTYALGVMALTGGFVASNVVNDNVAKVSAAEITNESRLLVTKSEYTHGGNVTSRIQVTDITSRENLETVEQINGVSFSHLSIYYTGNTFSYTGYGDTFYVDISDLDNFNLETHLLKHTKDSSTTERTGQTGYSGSLYLINKNGNIVEFMEREDFQDIVKNIYDKCVRSVVTLETEGTEMSVRSISLTSSTLGIGTINNEEGTVTFSNVASSGISHSLSITDVNIDLYIRNVEDLLFATMDGSGLFTELDIKEAEDKSYQKGFNDGFGVVSAPNTDAEGKYSYLFEYTMHENDTQSKYITINETDKKVDLLTTMVHVFTGSVDFNFYSNAKYVVNIDGVSSIDDITIDNITRYGDDTITNTETGYLNYMYFDFYSESNNLLSFINSVNFDKLKEKVTALILENEISQLNEGVSGIVLNPHMIQLRYFGNLISADEETGILEYSQFTDGFIGITGSDGSNLTVSVIKRSYNDLMYGTVLEEGYTEGQFQQYGELKYQEGYLDGVHAVENGEDAGTGIPEDSDYFRGWEAGFQSGVESVDITSDNEEAINEYITSNNMKTEEEYLAYGEEKYQEGKDENANEYAERLNELDTTIANLNKEIDTLNSKINDYESTDDKYQLGWENGKIYGESIGYDRGFQEALSEDLESYGQEQYTKGYNTALSIGFSNGYNQAMQEKDEEIGNIEQEKDSLVEQVESLQNDITNLNNRINTLTGTINNMNGLLDTKYQEGFEAGVGSVDITSDNEEIYQKGYSAGYTQCEIDNPPSVTYPENTYEFGFRDGFTAGAKSVDITIDNQQAIEDYINNENMKTEEEFLSYGEEKYSLGYKDNAFGKQVKRLGSNIGTFFVNLGKGIVQYVAFGWIWDKGGKFMPNF